MSQKPRNVYFIKPVGMDGPVKIGISCVPESRLYSLTLWSPWPLEVIGSVVGSAEDETYLHDCFADHHLHHEWFNSSPKLRGAIETILHAGTVDAIRGETDRVGNIRMKRKRFEWSPEARLRASYNSRVNHAPSRAEKQIGARCRNPDDVESIMYRWDKDERPSADEFAILDSHINNPAARAIPYARHGMKEAAE
jgi:hypothetical protein